MIRLFVFLFIISAVLYGFWRLVPKKERRQILRETWFQIGAVLVACVIFFITYGTFK